MTTLADIDVGARPGEIVGGKYRIERVLGAGGMGVVVSAHHIQLDEKVALKFLLPEALGSADAVARFEREARAAVKIKSEHVARVIDVGKLPNGAPYIVMEYLEGGDLSGWLRQRGPLPVEQAVEFVLQACVAIADAHALGIVHRDLKPSNLFCVRRSDGRLSIKVLDFGISKLTEANASARGVSATKTSAMMGSPLYMSPEQMRSSKDVDARTDIWALGVILFELTAGRPPFLSDSVTDLAIKIATESPPAVCTFRPDVPVELEAIILRCLEKKLEDRYQNIGELAVGLLPFAPASAKASVDRIAGIIQSAGLSSSAPPPAGPSATAMFPSTFPAVGRTTSGATRGKKTALGAGIVGLLAVAGIAGVGVWPRGPTERTEQPRGGQPTMSAAAAESILGPDATPSAARNVPIADATASVPPEVSSSLPAVVAPASAVSHKPPKAGAPSAGVSPPSLVSVQPAAPPPPPGRPNCDPPYYYDKQGNRIFKPECPL